MRKLLVFFILAATALPLPCADPPAKADDRPTGTIAFSSHAPRGWDLYVTDLQTKQTRRLTDHPALDYNAAFSPDGRRIAFVSERDGNLELYVMNTEGNGLQRLTTDFALDDHPTWSPDGKQLAFCSSRQPAKTPGQAWNAVHVMNADGSGVRRISPEGTTDYSPAWSPRGDLVTVASGSGVAGGTDIFAMKPDGSDRRQVVKNGGWPTFSPDGQTVYFHSKRDGSWGVFRVKLDGSGVERLTPKEIEAFTPRAAGSSLALAVKRGQHRQIELFDLETRKLTAITAAAAADHWNPSLSADGRAVVYHKTTADYLVPHVELWGAPPDTKLQMLRLDGAFPAFAPDNQRVALTSRSLGGLDVMKLDGSKRKTIYKGEPRSIFSLSWSHQSERVAFAHGTAFQGPEGKVDITTVAPDGAGYKKLTENAGNNAFPSFSPDGKQLVFRSGRDQHKNLYVMNADGSGVRRLTNGNWTDTMPDWSPTGEWITFASDRDPLPQDGGRGGWGIWLIKPDGTGLRKLIGGGGRHNHPHFSPDGKWIVFTSQRAGLSAEDSSLPFQFQPYGDLFASRTDGTGLVRLAHNGFEEGTPAWSPVLTIKPSTEGRKLGTEEY